MESQSLEKIVDFQIYRAIIGIAKDALELLELNHQQIKTLEKLLVDMGIDKYKESSFDYQKDRAVILSKANDNIRQCQSFLSNFEIKLKQ